MRTLILVSILAACGIPGFSQTPSAPQQGLPKHPREILAAAGPYYDFHDQALKPWHLKATYQLYDEKGKPTEQGSFEYWWASAGSRRSTWIRKGAAHTNWHMEDGREAYIENGDRLGYFERTIFSDLFEPLPAESQIDPSKSDLQRNSLNEAGTQLPCVSIIPHNATQSDYRFYPTYCFDPSVPALRMTYKINGSVVTTYSHIIRFQGKYLPRQVQVVAGPETLFAFNVDSIEPLDPKDAALMPSSDAIFKPDTVQSIADVKFGTLAKKETVVYPLRAKEEREQGIVLVDALIGTDGKIKDPRIVSSTSSLLSTSVLKAISEWEYTPNTLDGKPVEVDTVISTSFTLTE